MRNAPARKAEIEEMEAASVLQGFAASGGIVQGRCRVLTDIKELSKIEEGDILVFATPAPKLAPVMEKLKGLVTREGGQLSGATYYARERRIPCVTGVGSVMEVIDDGQIIRVDGYEGTVTLL
jgi:pyruvate, water dikinase